mgnify:CR=1 FL=1
MFIAELKFHLKPHQSQWQRKSAKLWESQSIKFFSLKYLLLVEFWRGEKAGIRMPENKMPRSDEQDRAGEVQGVLTHSEK